MDAREYFDSVEAAVREHRAAELTLAFGEPRRGQGGRSSLPGDPTARAAESSARARATLDRTDAVIGEALRRIDGLRLLVGRKAEVMELRHISLMTWPDLARELGISESTARRWHDVCCDCADAYGWAHVVNATGGAEG